MWKKSFKVFPVPTKNQKNHLNSPEKFFVETEKSWDDIEIQLDFWVPHRFWEGFLFFSKMGLPLVQQQPHSWQSIKGFYSLPSLMEEWHLRHKVLDSNAPPQCLGFSTLRWWWWSWWQRINLDSRCSSILTAGPIFSRFFGAGMWGGPTKKVDDTMSRPPSQ